MADSPRDTEDQILETLFESEPVHDDGFSVRAMKLLRRRMWVRRLALPIAFLLGAVISAKPLSQLIATFLEFVLSLTAGLQSIPVGHSPLSSIIVIALLLTLGVFMVGKVFETD